MKYVDLHVHSTASDGTLSPTEVVELALEKDLAAIALSDHDTVKGISEAQSAAAYFNQLPETSEAHKHLEVIPATELSCYYGNTEIHILGLFVDHTNKHLVTKLHEYESVRTERNYKMLKRFQDDGFDITLEDLQSGNPDTVITRAHFARALVEKGYCKDKNAAFAKYLGKDCKYYVSRVKVQPEEAISLILEANGLPFLAHPMLYNLGYSQVEELVQYLISLGLKGIEAYHSSNNISQSDKLRSLAYKYNLAVSGGSDFHGSNKPDIALGTGRGGLRVTEGVLSAIKRYV